MGVLSYGYKGLKAGVTKLTQKLSGQGKTKFTGKAIDKVKPGTSLTFKRKEQDDFVKYRQKLHDSAKFDTPTKNKLKMKQPLYKINKRKSEYKTPDEPKFSKGGRVGLKRGTFPDHSGDGKITQKDILMAKGVIPKPKKSKSPIDKVVRKT